LGQGPVEAGTQTTLDLAVWLLLAEAQTAAGERKFLLESVVKIAVAAVVELAGAAEQPLLGK
jgi:hypothetical protein